MFINSIHKTILHGTTRESHKLFPNTPEYGFCFFHAPPTGFQKGDVLAVCLENRPEYTQTWLGVAKFGGVSALINFNVRGVALKHTMDIVKAKGVLYSEETENGKNNGSKQTSLKKDCWIVTSLV